MTAQILDRVLTAYRIGDPDGAFPFFDSTGSKLSPGRWNTADSPMMYAAAHYSTAMLEKLVRCNGHMPPNQHWIDITIPPGTSYENFSPPHHAGWDDDDSSVAREYGAAWQQSKRSLILIVPIIVALTEHNIMINDAHPDMHKISHGLYQPICWDNRLFRA